MLRRPVARSRQVAALNASVERYRCESCQCTTEGLKSTASYKVLVPPARHLPLPGSTRLCTSRPSALSRRRRCNNQPSALSTRRALHAPLSTRGAARARERERTHAHSSVITNRRCASAAQSSNVILLDFLDRSTSLKCAPYLRAREAAIAARARVQSCRIGRARTARRQGERTRQKLRLRGCTQPRMHAHASSAASALTACAPSS